MKVLTVIGNGLDLGHSLPTRFDDFIQSNWQLYERYYAAFKGENSWNDIENKYKQLLCHAISKRSWADVTEEIERIINEYGLNKYGEIDYYNYEFEAWDKEINLIARFVELLNQFEFDFRAYLRAFCSDEVICNKQTYRTISEILHRSNTIINFNYTHTIELLYGINNVIHIHGDINDNIAIGSSALDDAKQSMVDLEYPTIEKFSPDEHGFSEMMMYYDEDMEGNRVEAHFIRRFFDEVAASTAEKENEVFALLDAKSKDALASREQTIEMLNSSHYDEVYIIGHSLGEADYPVFDAINKDATVMCSFHDDNDRENKEAALNDLKLSYHFIKDSDLYNT